MPKLYGSYWNERLGVCEKHFLPTVPCPACLAEHDPDVQVRIIEMDIVALDDPELTVRDLLPHKDGDWLLDCIA